jgi:AcrR family transcriptional regulator
MVRVPGDRLTRDQIVATAIRTARKGALSTLSMRGLAQQLNVTPMALYAHVADKDEILDEILEDALAAEARPAAPNDDWRSWMIGFAEQLHRVLVDRPELLDRYCRRPVGVTTALERMEAALSMLADAGFDDEEAVDVFAAVQTVTLGFTALEVARRSVAGSIEAGRGTRASTDVDPASPQYWPTFFATLPPDRYPHLVRSRPNLGGFTTAARFDEVLRALLDGIDRRSRLPRGRRPTMSSHLDNEQLDEVGLSHKED